MGIATIVIPLIMTIGHFFIVPSANEFGTTFYGTVSFTLSILLVIISAMMINSLFSVDLRTDTLKSIIPLPVSSKEYLNGKLATLLVWMVVFVFITWIVSLILYTIVGMHCFDLTIVMESLIQLIVGAILVFLIMTPVVFVYLFTKNQSLTLIITIVLLIFPILSIFGGSQMEFLSFISQYVPWSFIGGLVMDSPLEISSVSAYLIVIVTFVVGYIASHLCLSKMYID